MKKRLYYLAAIVVLLSSCTGRRYGHYSYVKNRQRDIAENTVKQHIPEPATLSSKQPMVLIVHDAKNITTANVKLREKINYKNSRPVELKTRSYTYQQEELEHELAPDIENQIPNSGSNDSFVFALITIGLFIGSIIVSGLILSQLFFALGIAFGYASLLASIIALSKEKGKHKNRWKAIFGLVVGILTILLCIFMVVYVLMTGILL